ncbi:MAG TPA: tetratricopeptide repeat protein [Pirellulaceae bacterium]|nr:tetratricopeptide repeat protein [Pirellulaceae bacterium]HMO91819.1 tetratricopeptide repeat protein [Pirellulaceae bacterium]HMP69882.1 tetratricopeptide repeat protein [Pirellulaceae bacterium]
MNRLSSTILGPQSQRQILSVRWVFGLLLGSLLLGNAVFLEAQDESAIETDQQQSNSAKQTSANDVIDIKELMERGEGRLNRGDFHGAVEDFSAVIRQQPDFAKAFFLRGQAKYGLGFTNYALSDYHEAVRLNPDYTEAYRRRGELRVYRAIGDIDEAFADLDRAIEGGFEVAASYADRGFSHYYQGDILSAVEDCDKAIELAGPTAGFLFNRGLARFALGNVQGAFKDFDDDIAKMPNFPSSYLYRGFAYLLIGSDDDAERDFEKCIQLDPNQRRNVELHRQLAKLLQGESQPETADQYVERAEVLFKSEFDNECIADCSRAIILEEGNARAHELRGNSLARLGYLTSAIRDFDQAIASRPGFAEYYFTRADCRYRQKSFEQALADLDECLKREPRHFGAMNLRGNILQETCRFAEAVAAYEQRLQYPTAVSSIIYENLGRALNDSGEPARALVAMEKAIQIGGGAESYTERAIARAALGQRTAALEDLAKAKELAPDDYAIAQEEAKILMALGLHDEAIRAADRVLELSPYHTEGFRLRAMAKELKGDVAGALADLEEALQWNPRTQYSLLTRGLIRRKHDQAELAQADFESALRLAPHDRSYIEACIANTEASSALAAQFAFVGLAAKSSEASAGNGTQKTTTSTIPAAVKKLFETGVELYSEGEWDKANTEFKKAMTLYPKFPAAAMYRGLIHLQKGEAKDAERLFAEAIAAQPDLKETIEAERAKIIK